MQQEQILKKLEWLDDERRKDKSVIATLEDRIKSLEETIQGYRQQVKEMNSEISRLKALQTKVEQTDEVILKLKIETKQQLDELEKETRRREEEAEKIRRVEIKSLDSGIAEIRKEISVIADLRRGLNSRLEEEIRLSRSVEELNEAIEQIRRNDEEISRLIRQTEDNRRQDSKRLTDLQGEISAVRKLYNELQGQFELFSTSVKKIENRIGEVENLDAERKQLMVKFIEEQSLAAVERERKWKEWQGRLDQIEGLAEEIQKSLMTVESTTRNVNRVQQTIEELAQKVDRRVNELTELQKLGEERLRQEWVAFRSDDQKRWANYTVVQEEMRSELIKQIEKLQPRLGEAEDKVQTLQDLLQVMNDQTERHLRELLEAVHNWATEYESAVKQV